MPRILELGKWADWPKADQKRYKKLKALNQSNVRMSKEDFAWFMAHKRALTFYSRLFRRHYARTHGTSLVREKCLRGFNSKPR